MMYCICAEDGKAIPFGFALSLMDEEICASFASECICCPQHYYNRYSEMHLKAFKTPFIAFLRKEWENVQAKTCNG